MHTKLIKINKRPTLIREIATIYYNIEKIIDTTDLAPEEFIEVNKDLRELGAVSFYNKFKNSEYEEVGNYAEDLHLFIYYEDYKEPITDRVRLKIYNYLIDYNPKNYYRKLD